MSSSEDTADIDEQLQRRQIEVLQEQQDGNISIGNARREVTALESLFPRVSLQSTEEENGVITAYNINVRSFTAGPFGGMTEDFAKMKARLFTKIKLPTKSISNIRIVSSKDITLPFVNISTGRTFNTIRVEIE